MLKQISKLLKVLGSDTNPKEIALGAVLGMFAAFLSGSILNVLFFLLVVIIIRANIPMFILCMGIFKLLAIFIDPAGHIIGKAVLTAGFMLPLWKFLSGLPVIPLSYFNNTVIMGDFILGLVLLLPVWFGSIKLTEWYRKNLAAKVKKLKIVQALTIGKFAGKGVK